MFRTLYLMITLMAGFSVAGCYIGEESPAKRELRLMFDTKKVTLDSWPAPDAAALPWISLEIAGSPKFKKREAIPEDASLMAAATLYGHLAAGKKSGLGGIHVGLAYDDASGAKQTREFEYPMHVVASVAQANNTAQAFFEAYRQSDTTKLLAQLTPQLRNSGSDSLLVFQLGDLFYGLGALQEVRWESGTTEPLPALLYRLVWEREEKTIELMFDKEGRYITRIAHGRGELFPSVMPLMP